MRKDQRTEECDGKEKRELAGHIFDQPHRLLSKFDIEGRCRSPPPPVRLHFPSSCIATTREAETSHCIALYYKTVYLILELLGAA